MEKQHVVAAIVGKVGEPASNLDAGFAAKRSSSLAGNLVFRAITNWSSQLVSWAAFLLVVRVLAPSDFGLVALCVVLYSQLRLAGEFGIPTTIVTFRNLSEDEIAQLNTLGLLLGITAFLLSCALAWPAALFFKTPRLAPVTIITSIALIALGVRSVPEGLLSKDMRFKALSMFDAIRDVFGAILMVVLALLGCGYWALVLGNMLSIVLRSAIVVNARPHRFAWPRLASLRKPLLFSWHVLVSVFAWSTYNTLDNVTAGRVLGTTAVGLYGMAWTLANLPLEKVVSLVTTIIPSYLAAVQKEPAALRHYLRTLTEALALTTFPATIGLALVAREFVPFALGSKWNGMILPLQVLCVYTAFRSLVALLPKLLTSVGKARFVMRVETSALIVMPIAFYIGSHWGIGGIAFGWVAAYPLVAIPLYWNTFKTIEMDFAEYFGALRPGLDGAIAMAVAVGLLKRMIPSTQPLLLRLLIEIAAGATVYIATVMLFHRERVLTFFNMAKGIRRKKKGVD